MTTLTNKHIHTPHMESISEYCEAQYTFCESCEQNIDRFWIEDPDRLSWWSDWSITK
jgi:hypothetical protein